MKSRALAFAALLLCVAAAAAQESLVIRGGTVHPVSGPDIANGVVVVRGNKIVNIGTNVSVPSGARTIDARGLHVYPGMIDAYTAVGLMEIGSIRETADMAEIGSYNPQLTAATAVNPESEHIPVTRANGITTVLTAPSGGVIAGQPALMNLAGWTIEEMAVRRSLGMIINFPSIRMSRRGGGFSGESSASAEGRSGSFAEAKRAYDRQIAELHDWLEKARHYGQARNAEAPDVKRDLKLEALVPLVKGETAALVAVQSARDIRNAIDFAEKEKLRVVLLGATDAWKEIDLLKKKQIPVILGPVLDLPEREDDPYDRAYSTAADLYKAGIKFAFATRSGGRESASQIASRNLPFQAGMAAAFGLPPEEALKAVTLYPAQILGVKDLGSLEAGKIANIIITDGDPLEAKTQVKHLVINGRVTSTDNKHRRLYEKYIARP